MLVIDKDGLLKEFIRNFSNELEWVLEQWKKDVEKFASDTIRKLGNPSASTKKIVNESAKMITIYFEANPTLLADIYGTGSAMKAGKNPKFQEYWNNRGSGFGQVNPARKTIVIEGRPKGKYVNIFGKERTSNGKNAGISVEGHGRNPIEPNKKLLEEYFGTAVEIANNFFKYSYLDKAISAATKKTKMYNYIKEVN